MLNDRLKKIRVGPWEFEVHLGDADPLPSNPHAHINQAPAPHESWSDPRTRTKVDLISGEIKQGSRVVGSLGNIRGAEQAFKEAFGTGCAVKKINAGNAEYWKILSGLGGSAIRLGGFGFAVFSMAADAKRVASADPCDRAKTAVNVGVGWATAWGVGVLLAKYMHPGVLAGVGYAQAVSTAVNGTPNRSYVPSQTTSSGWPY